MGERGVSWVRNSPGDGVDRIAGKVGGLLAEGGNGAFALLAGVVVNLATWITARIAVVELRCSSWFAGRTSYARFTTKRLSAICI